MTTIYTVPTMPTTPDWQIAMTLFDMPQQERSSYCQECGTRFPSTVAGSFVKKYCNSKCRDRYKKRKR